ncbi:hypothetical protein BH09VER1_BH09VER1_47160 [soil metagenome]
MKGLKKYFSKSGHPGSALVITLAIIVLASVIALAYLAGVSLESKTARLSLDEQKASAMADLGLNTALAKFRDAVGPWDSPYENFCAVGSIPPTFYWSVSPGRLTKWSYASVAPVENIALFSESTTTNLVNLNRRLPDGSYPIIGGSNAPDVSVKWVNVLGNPTLPASSNNPVIGRYAFWVDDESAKINLNTADGSQKADLSKFMGAGTPAEVSIQALSQGNSNLTQNAASNIVQLARTGGLHSPREILRAAGTTMELYTNNVFNLTVSSRSPDLNVFGQPKMPLIPGYRSIAISTNFFTNGITMEPFQEIYPGFEQLPRMTFKGVTINSSGLMVTNTYASRHWPTAFQQTLATGSPIGTTGADNVPWCNGAFLASYLAGTNAVGKAITWPAFPGSEGESFLDKYTARQIDSVVMQICDLGGKATSPDFFEPGSTDSNATMTRSSPGVGWGWLSGQLVSGMGRGPKVTKLLMKFTTLAGDVSTPPALTADTYIEWWFPSRFQGQSLYHNQNPNNSLAMGDNPQINYLNSQDTPCVISSTSSVCAPLPRFTGSLSYWGDNLIQNNQGIDFSGNVASLPDPDQGRAQQFHTPFAGTNAPYMGAGPGTPLLRMSTMVKGSVAATNEWAPGEIRCVRNIRTALRYPMQTNAAGGTLNIEGGIAVLAQHQIGRRTEVDPAPLEAVRGSVYPGTGASGNANNLSRTDEWFSSNTVYSRVTNSVIPMVASLPVPTNGDLTVNTAWAYAHVSDPLVNKFPGDWITNTTTSAPATTMSYAAATISAWASTKENASITAELSDPDSYWMPVIDSFLFQGATPQIPRSARFPSIGYLQYVRTGIIPDDEVGQAYSTQHGTPFRLLNFAPSTENQKTTRSGSLSYPDWAMLDLLYIPSTLIPWGGPYGSSTNLLYYGTYGGATSGRINPNGSVIYTTNVTVPQPLVSRDVPLQAVLRGLKVNQSATASATTGDDFTTPSWSGGTPVDEVAIAKAIENYVRTNGPLRMPAEICNIPEIAALRPSVNPTRNDLVRQIVGALTTQSNVFSVWVAGQAVQKVSRNTDYGNMETGDVVLSEVKVHYVVERYLDPGADGVYGNVANPGPDGVVGSLDDPVDANNNPASPKYLYRVIASEDIRG